MIAHLPQQQVHTHLLVLSLIILFLTVYPYLFSHTNTCCFAAAYSSENHKLKHELIEKFDIIENDAISVSRLTFKRSTFEQQLDDRTNYVESNAKSNKHPEGQQQIQFSSLGRDFTFILSRTTHLISHDFNVVAVDAEGNVANVPFDRNRLEILEGNLKGDPNSRAAVSFDKHNKLMTAQIKSGHELIIVEPTYLHKDYLHSSSDRPDTNINHKLFSKTMIVFRLSDHEQFRASPDRASDLFIPEKSCAGFRPNESDFDVPQQISSDEDDIFKYYEPIVRSIGQTQLRSKRDIEFPYVQKQHQVREKNRCTLHLVADYLFYKHIGNGDFQTTINYLLALINRVNQIYLPTQWETGDDTINSFSNIGFIVQNITIHQEYTRSSSGDHYNMQSDKVWGAREYLDNFSRHSPPKHYCLAHLLTYRKFDSPVLGLAYVASTRFGTIGGICSPTQQRGDMFYKHNTGISTSRGINGETLITRQADLVLAHELGHNLGAEHDSDECRPPPSQGGAYLMHPYAVMGFEKNNKFLSSCSRIAIGRVIRRKASTCFVAVVDNVCGNGVVEKDRGEECDGGDVGHGHSDPCCDSSCRLTPGSQCSDRDSWCCSRCRIVPAGRPCSSAEEFNCKQASYCDGQSAECPQAPDAKDDTICVGRGICRGGECRSLCQVKDLYPCMCTNPTDACKLCCKPTVNSTCVPYDQTAPYLPDGVLCYKGVCEKGRCEQPIQDVVERLWDVIEDINLATVVKFFRDNIILVVLLVSIPIWCLVSHFINEFDNRIKKDVVNTIMKYRKHQKPPPTQSPFLPPLFVGDDNGSTASLNNIHDEATVAHKFVQRNRFALNMVE